MLADLWPVFVPLILAVGLFALLLRGIEKRRGYCGKDPDNCLVCTKECTYYYLDQVSQG